jgi:hypothetical protein
VLSPFYTTFEKEFDAKPYVQFVSTTWPILPLFLAAMYLLFVLLVPPMMEHHKPFYIKKQVAVWNFTLSLFSWCGMIRVVPHLLYVMWINSFEQTICMKVHYMDGGALGLWSMLFVFSKVVELLDTVFLVLNKKKLVFLHWYHHLIVLLLSLHAYLSRSPISLYAMSMNYSIHAIMYGYYFLRTIEKWPRWLSPQFITVAQITQMIAGSFLCLMGILYNLYNEKCHAPFSNMIFAAAIYITYFYLFAQFFSRRFAPSKKFYIGNPP